MPWRDQLRVVVEAQARFNRAVADLDVGPARERIEPYVARVDDAVRQGAAAAARAAAVDTPQRTAQATAVSTELADLQKDGATADEAGRRHEEALAAQLRSLRRSQALGQESLDQLRILASRIDDAALALVELSQDASELVADPGGPVLSVFDEIDALRAGMAASARALDPGATGPAPPGGAPLGPATS
jgi:hypothetical protein